MDRICDEVLATAPHTEEWQQYLAPILNGAMHAIDFKRFRVVVNLQCLVAAPAPEQVPRRNVPLGALSFGSMGYADGAFTFRFRTHDGHAALCWYCFHRSSPSSLRMRDNIEDDIGVASDDEIESPFLVDASLPKVLRFVILLGVQ